MVQDITFLIFHAPDLLKIDPGRCGDAGADPTEAGSYRQVHLILHQMFE